MIIKTLKMVCDSPYRLYKLMHQTGRKHRIPINYSKGIIVCLFLLMCGFSAAQSAYFQQRLEYKISVSLDDSLHFLHGNLNLKYVNNSPDILDRIGFHLWPNAYQNQHTAFAKQKIQQDDLSFYYSKPEDLGYMDHLNFYADTNLLNWTLDHQNIDMTWVHLSKLLLPGDSVIIETAFRVKLPSTVSRLGHIGQSYQISQWYPKPAVYDRKGWHLMPYLDQGEFYSEFGTYTVDINLPKNYIVAATGTLLTESEQSYRNQRKQFTQSVLLDNNLMDSLMYTESSQERKTIRFYAENVHDFAWFADKSFLILEDYTTLTNDRKVLCASYFTSPYLWDESLHAIQHAIQFYSDQLGPYPYPQATAVESNLGVGGGMEYPMITVIGPSYSKQNLESVIVHEVGHNWLYGILASNERDHPYLDEGINSFYENKYLDSKKLKDSTLNGLKKITGNTQLKQLQYQLFTKASLAQFPDQHAQLFSSLNYGLDVYGRSAWYFTFLEDYLGPTTFREIMQLYYERWKFKHPYPEDLQRIFEEKTAKDFSWFFKDLMASEKTSDYSIQCVQKVNDSMIITLRNNKSIPAPLKIRITKSDQVIEEKWIDGFKDKFHFGIKTKEIDQMSIDPQHQSFDFQDYNNYYAPNRILPKLEPIRFHLIPLIDQNQQTDIGLSPCLGYNAYDGLQLGLFISKPWLPSQNFRVDLLPQFGLKSKSLIGQLNVSNKWNFADTKIRSLQTGIQIKNYTYNSLLNSNIAYTQFKPYIGIVFSHPAYLNRTSSLSFNSFIIKNQYLDFTDSTAQVPIISNSWRSIYKMDYLYEQASIFGKTKFTFQLKFGNQQLPFNEVQSFCNVQSSYLKEFRYSPDRYITVRSFISFYPYNSERNSPSISDRSKPNSATGSSGLSFQNYLDSENEFLFIGRSAYKGIWSQQVFIEQGGFKLAHGATQRDNIGNSNRLIAAINLGSDLPIPKIGKLIKAYMDIGYFDQNSIPIENRIIYSGGLMLQLFYKRFSIYLPVINSNSINTLYRSADHSSYWNRICFSLNLEVPKLSQLIKLVPLE